MWSTLLLCRRKSAPLKLVEPQPSRHNASNATLELIASASTGCIPRALRSIARGADIHIGGLLHVATSCNQLEIMSTLLGLGVSPNAVSYSDNRVYTPSGQSLVLVQEAMTALQFVTTPEATCMLLKAGADPNYGTYFGMTSLIKAVKDGRPEIVQILLDAGSDVNAQRNTPDAAAALHFAAADGDSIITALLLKRGADVQMPFSQDRLTAMHMAAMSGSVEVVSMLMAAGAAIDSVAEPDGFTPLTAALEQGNSEVAELLVLSGAIM